MREAVSLLVVSFTIPISLSAMFLNVLVGGLVMIQMVTYDTYFTVLE